MKISMAARSSLTSTSTSPLLLLPEQSDRLSTSFMIVCTPNVRERREGERRERKRKRGRGREKGEEEEEGDREKRREEEKRRESDTNTLMSE